VAELRRSRGIDVTTTAEADLKGSHDEEQLAFATGQGRVLVTRDADFLRLHRAGARHAGIAYFQRARSIGELVRSLVLLRQRLSPADMQNHVEFI
jgi:hypothetical protein